MYIPYISNLFLTDEHPLAADSFPGNLPFVKNLDLKFDTPVTFFVGENGSGKSTLLEATAVRSRLPASGGSTSEAGENLGLSEQCILAKTMRVGFVKQPRDRYFFRADTQAHFASLLEAREEDPDFLGDPYTRYGGKTLHHLSHGEAFLAVMNNRFSEGLFFLDEPESALSPQRQLQLLALMQKFVAKGTSQFIIATHSPILMTFPDATIVSFDFGELEAIELEETSHFQITKDLLNNPQMYWQHLSAGEGET